MATKLTRKQIGWLYSRGGRTASDAEHDKKGWYVWMSNGLGENVKVYIPKFELSELVSRALLLNRKEV